MQCPKCQQPLQGIDYEGVHVETCPACGGDWLDAGELGNIVEARRGRFNEQECLAIAQAAKITGTQPIDRVRQLVCPKCGGATHTVNYGDDSGIIIDECAKCRGVWLERGELEKIEELVEGWDDGLPQDLAKYGPKLRQIEIDDDADQAVHPAHIHLVNSVINGILNIFGE